MKRPTAPDGNARSSQRRGKSRRHEASGCPPDLLDGVVVHPRLDAKGPARVRLDLQQMRCEVVPVIADYHDLAVRDANFLARVGRSGIGTGLLVDAASQLAVLYLGHARHDRTLALRDESAAGQKSHVALVL